MHPQVAEDLRLEMQRQEHAEEVAMKNRSARDTALFTENYCRLREQWLLRGLLRHPTTTIAELLEQSPSRQWRIMEALKVIAPAAPLPTDVATIQAALQQRWATVQNLAPVERRGRPFTHLAALGQELGLTAVEQDVLLFALMLRGDPVLSSGMEALGEVNEYEVREMLAVILDLSGDQVRRALADQGHLLTSGLVEFEERGCYRQPLTGLVKAMPQLVRVVLDPFADPDGLFQECLHPAAAPELRPADYAHIRRDLGLLTRLLRRATAQGERGVNILLHGEPGTGKTQLAHTVAQAAGLTLYQVSANKEKNSPHDAEDRLAAFRLGQSLLRHRRDCLLLFDEAGDVLKHSREEQNHYRQLSKPWLNQTLETNPVATIWTCNDLCGVDEAFLRRFDHLLELVTPPAAVRQRMLAHHLGAVPVSSVVLTRLAKTTDLPPGHLQRAAKVLRLLDYQHPARNDRCLSHLLEQRTRQFSAEESADQTATVPVDFDLELLRVETDLNRLTQGLTRRRQGRLCLYGPPGTGKSAFAAWLAQQLEMPLLRKQASDLLGMYVGENEQNIAAMFKEAHDRKALLLLDEADSFLRTRRSAHQRWEVSQVNELLVQMERYEGILICATNLMEELDEAVLRRFDFKLHFQPLSPAQVERRFLYLTTRVTPEDKAGRVSALPSLRALNNLTPGDFAVAQRQAFLLDEPLTPARLLAVLMAESQAKPGSQRRPIGFVN
ncbi:MAG: ATP-binding protein [Candidatus Competibacteraceae bacterium]|nr:ATP-binding protein [Candidatus Competibacteraceae bacterium]